MTELDRHKTQKQNSLTVIYCTALQIRNFLPELHSPDVLFFIFLFFEIYNV